MSKDLVQQQFGANAAAYATSTVHAKGASLARLVELVKPKADWAALDIATGAGHTALAFAPHVASVIASDLTPEMLVESAKLAAAKGYANMTTAQADAERLPFPDATFDLVTSRIAPHHFPDIPAFLRESRRVLKPGVTLMMVEEPGCHFCRKWDAEIGPGYPSTAEGRFAPLKRVRRSAPELQGLAPVIYTPTFIVMREGRELGRLAGYPGADYFYPELTPLLAAAGFAPATKTDRISAP